MDKLNYKKYFLRILIIALSISAIIGIFIFLVGDFGEIEIRLLLTTLTIGVYSLTGLCSSAIHNRKELITFSVIGMLISVLGFLTTIAAIWEIIDFNAIWKAMLVFIILSATVAHISLLLLIKSNTASIKYLLTATIIFISIVAVMLIKSTITEFDEDEFYFRLLGVFSILDILGTIVTPIINKITEKKE